MELINKKDVLKCFCTTLLLPSGVDVQPIMLWYDQIIGNIKSLPTIESRPKGKWVDNQCSNCREFALQWGDESMAESDFCPHCGADMRGEE